MIDQKIRMIDTHIIIIDKKTNLVTLLYLGNNRVWVWVSVAACENPVRKKKQIIYEEIISFVHFTHLFYNVLSNFRLWHMQHITGIWYQVQTVCDNIDGNCIKNKTTHKKRR